MNRYLAIIFVLYAVACSDPPSDPPEEECDDDHFRSTLTGRAIEERDGVSCISKTEVVVGEYCFPAQRGEEFDEYSDGMIYVGVEPHSAEALSDLRERGFEKIEPTEIPQCNSLDARAQ